MSKADAGFTALADPTRRAILDLLRARRTCTAGEIAAHFAALSRPAVSRHLRVLREAGLVRAEEVGREWRYHLDAGAIARLYHGWFERFAPLWEQSLTRLKRQVEET